MYVISLLELVIAVCVVAENKISTFCQQVFTGASKINFTISKYLYSFYKVQPNIMANTVSTDTSCIKDQEVGVSDSLGLHSRSNSHSLGILNFFTRRKLQLPVFHQ